MSIENLNIKSAYDSDDDDILNDFYIPVLLNSIEYLRIAGFFSSAALAVAAKGIQGLIKSGGEMKIIAGAMVSEKDVIAIQNGIENPEDILKRTAIDDFDSIDDEFIRNHVMALGWLIAKGKLEIRIAIVTDDEGTLLDAKSIQQIGIFHQKVGIFKGKNDKRLSFSGSVNETARAWTENVEEFKVFREWIHAENEHFCSDLKKFNKYWEGKSKRVKVIDVPQAIKEKLISIAPYNPDSLKLNRKKTKKGKRIRAWKHQEVAVNRFIENSYFGIFKMATGTGKTITAFLALKEYFKNVKNSGNRIIIIIPGHELLIQWIKDLKVFFENDCVLSYDSKVTETEKRNARKIWKANLPSNINIFLVIAIDSIKNFKPFNMYSPNFIIGDEVHSYGTERRTRELIRYLSESEYRLGLSATPERYYDIEGTERVFEQFGQIVYEYSIKEAQQDSILSKYFYYPTLVTLTKDEEEEVEKLTKSIGKKIAMNFKKAVSENDKVISHSVDSLLNKRARIYKKACYKLDALRNILEKNKIFKQCIIYCEDTEQLDEVQAVFDNLRINTYIKYHSKIVNREDALELFKNNNCNFIISMHCLDQGINIPSCESLIFMSSSGNPREYIQRRGRVLRNPQNVIKQDVKIYDIFAFPSAVKESYKGLILTQLLRAWEFIRCSQSPEAKITFEKIMDDYNITSLELEKIIEEW